MRYILPMLLLAGSLYSGEAHAYQEQTLCVSFNEAANTDDEYYAAWPHKGTWQITSAVIAPATAVAADATNTIVTTVATNAGTASTTWTTLATTTTDSDATEVAWVIGTVIDLTVDVDAATISRGYQIRIDNTNAGSGQAWDGTLCVSARKVG